MKEILKDYFTYNEEQKQDVLEQIHQNLIDKIEYLENELGTDVWRFYIQSYNQVKEESLKEENYEMCEVIDKLLIKLNEYASTRQNTK